MIWVLKQRDDAIHAFCGLCKTDEYLIYEWESTIWADGPMAPVDIQALAEERDDVQVREPGPGDSEELLARALSILGSRLDVEDVRQMIDRAPDPTAVLQQILESAVAPPSMSTVERLVPVLMDLWNSTPRTELGGLSPEEMVRSRPPGPNRQPARNAPCPCGSGKKYKKCCLLAAPD